MIPLYYTIFGYAIGFFLCKSVMKRVERGEKGRNFLDGCIEGVSWGRLSGEAKT